MFSIVICGAFDLIIWHQLLLQDEHWFKLNLNKLICQYKLSFFFYLFIKNQNQNQNQLKDTILVARSLPWAKQDFFLSMLEQMSG